VNCRFRTGLAGVDGAFQPVVVGKKGAAATGNLMQAFETRNAILDRQTNAGEKHH
jgi:hypothetical protein